MKFFLNISLLLFVVQAVQSQELFVGTDSFLSVKNKTSIMVQGLLLEPSNDYLIPSDTQISLVSTPVNTSNVSINRHYVFTNPLSNYRGKIVFNYKEEELNNLEETNLYLQLLSTDNLWYSYKHNYNTTEKELTYFFTEAVNFSKVTASLNNTLANESWSLFKKIKVSPNPTSGIINIHYSQPIKTTLYNMLGQVVYRGTSNNIDVSLYNNATYFLTMEDLANHQQKTIKIIKQ